MIEIQEATKSQAVEIASLIMTAMFSISADYDGIGAKGSKFAFYL